MHNEENIPLVSHIMLDFAGGTGLVGQAQHAPRRYLWNDAFALCNFLELYVRSQDESWLDLARRLVDQVHHVLGRHRADAGKSGWISGLKEEEGKQHPTRGGLRIGKKMQERAPDEPADERLEWERDGQYYHYLTKWMHALQCMTRVTGDATYLRWAMELAQTAHATFCYPSTSEGSLALHWKMSVDLSRPLVRAAGQHDPLDGLVTYLGLHSAAKEFGEETFPDLWREITELAAMCRGKSWITDDALGVGGLLWDINRIEQLVLKGAFKNLRLFQQVVSEALLCLQSIGGGFLVLPARYRLAFRELGLSIGLRGIARFARLVDEHPEQHDSEFLSWLRPSLEGLTWHLPLIIEIEHFWLAERNKGTEQWKEHGDINMVMLATSLAPEQFLTTG